MVHAGQITRTLDTFPGVTQTEGLGIVLGRGVGVGVGCTVAGGGVGVTAVQSIPVSQ